MASSTLVVTLQGLQISNVQQVVTARGIDRVLVVDTASGFNSSAGIAAITGANGLRKAKAGSATELSDEPVSLAFAFAGGETTATISPGAYRALDSSGFAFVNDPSMSSFSSTVVLEADALNQAGYYGIWNAESAMALTRDLGSGVGASNAELESLQEALASTQLFNGFGASASTISVAPDVSFATAPTFTISGGGAAESGVLSDLKGTIKVNLTASEFTQLAKAKADAVAVKLSSVANVLVDQQSIVAEPTTAEDFTNLGASVLSTIVIPESSFHSRHATFLIVASGVCNDQLSPGSHWARNRSAWRPSHCKAISVWPLLISLRSNICITCSRGS